MALSNKLVSKFVKATKNDTNNTKKEKTVYGNIVFKYSNTYYALIDGATYDKDKINEAIQNGKTPDTSGLVPISRFIENVDLSDGAKKVIINIKDHNAVVTGTIDVKEDPVSVSKQIEDAVGGVETSPIAIADIQALWQ